LSLTKNEQDYRNAAVAVANGTANSCQIEMNDTMAKQVGQLGNIARDAQKRAGKK